MPRRSVREDPLTVGVVDGHVRVLGAALLWVEVGAANRGDAVFGAGTDALAYGAEALRRYDAALEPLLASFLVGEVVVDVLE